MVCGIGAYSFLAQLIAFPPRAAKIGPQYDGIWAKLQYLADGFDQQHSIK
jgi:hypothetical protein